MRRTIVKAAALAGQLAIAREHLTVVHRRLIVIVVVHLQALVTISMPRSSACEELARLVRRARFALLQWAPVEGTAVRDELTRARLRLLARVAEGPRLPRGEERGRGAWLAVCIGGLVHARVAVRIVRARRARLAVGSGFVAVLVALCKRNPGGQR